jgi:hypothetical protein
MWWGEEREMDGGERRERERERGREWRTERECVCRNLAPEICHSCLFCSYRIVPLGASPVLLTYFIADGKVEWNVRVCGVCRRQVGEMSGQVDVRGW